METDVSSGQAVQRVNGLTRPPFNGETPMRTLFLAALLSSGLGTVVLAAQDQRLAETPVMEPTTKKSDAPVNKFCAVMPDHAIDPKVTVTHDGKVYGLCCKDCAKDFNKDPKKYAEKAK